jgi:hypothetical protein
VPAVRQPLAFLVATFALGCGLDSSGVVRPGGGDRKYETVPSPTEPPAESPSSSTPPKNGRVEAGVVALYTFSEGDGSEVFDVSGRMPSTPLKIATPSFVTWETGFLRLKAPNLLLPSNDSVGVMTAIKTSNAFSVEAWISAATTTTILSRLVGSGPDGIFANFTLGADDTSLYLRLRTSAADPVAVSALSMVITQKLTHVIATREAGGMTRLYVDGTERAAQELAGDLSTWDTTYPLTVANAPSRDRSWLGDIHLVALYDRALGSAEVAKNYAAGP